MATVTFPRLLAICGLAISLLAPVAQAERIKDLASIAGVRQNQLMGYGLVVGLDGSGDQTTQTPFTIQSVAAMLQQQGINLPQGTSLQLKNVAAVMVTTSLPAFAQPGQMLDVTVSSFSPAVVSHLRATAPRALGVRTALLGDVRDRPTSLLRRFPRQPSRLNPRSA